MDYEKIEKSARIRRRALNIILYTLLTFWAVMVLFPFYWMILTSVKGYGAYNSEWIPQLYTLAPTLFYLIITGFIGAFKAYSDAVALFGTDLNAAEMNTIVGYIYDMLYGNSGGYPSYASAAAIVLFAIVLTITCINLLVSKKHVHYA